MSGGNYMTNNQITYVINTVYEYSLNAWIPLTDIPMITLGQMTNVYTDPDTMRFKFNMTTSNLEIVYGRVVDSVFVSEAGETSNYTPQSFVDFSVIIGFIKSVHPGHQGTYYKKYFGSFVNYINN